MRILKNVGLMKEHKRVTPPEEHAGSKGIERRDFLKLLALAGAEFSFHPAYGLMPQSHDESASPGRIPNEYSLLMPGEKEALLTTPAISEIKNLILTATVGKNQAALRPGEALDGWRLITIVEINGVATAIFEKHVTHRGAIAYVTEH